MPVRLAINGYGRIGRMVLRALYESGRRDDMQIVAVNDLGDARTNAHLTRYDSAHGRFPFQVEVGDGELVVNGDSVKVFAERNPADLPWKELDVDIVLECTGLVQDEGQGVGSPRSRRRRKVVVSAPAGTNTDATIVYGVNHHILDASHRVVSNASCTTNCLAPVAKVLHGAVGIEQGLMTTIHAFTNDQVLSDVFHKDLRRARSATQSMIPTKTGAAAAVGLVLPELDGRLDGFAIRVPTINVSVVDLSFISTRATSVEEVNGAVKSAAEGALEGVLAYIDEPLVSIDFNHHPASSVFDSGLTKVSGNLVKICTWYDNEWGFSNRMLDTTLAFARVG